MKIIHYSTDQLLPTRPYPPWEQEGCKLECRAGGSFSLERERRERGEREEEREDTCSDCDIWSDGGSDARNTDSTHGTHQHDAGLTCLLYCYPS